MLISRLSYTQEKILACLEMSSVQENIHELGLQKNHEELMNNREMNMDTYNE
jgi:hypothetical protein